MDSDQISKVIEYGSESAFWRLELDDDEMEVFWGIRRELEPMIKSPFNSDENLDYLAGMGAKLWFQHNRSPFRHTYKAAAAYQYRIFSRSVRRLMYEQKVKRMHMPILLHLPVYLPRMIMPLIYLIFCPSPIFGLVGEFLPLFAIYFTRFTTFFVISGGMHFTRLAILKHHEWYLDHQNVWLNIIFTVSIICSYPLWYLVSLFFKDGILPIGVFIRVSITYITIAAVAAILTFIFIHLIKLFEGLPNKYYKEKKQPVFSDRPFK